MLGPVRDKELDKIIFQTFLKFSVSFTDNATQRGFCFQNISIEIGHIC